MTVTVEVILLQMVSMITVSNSSQRVLTVSSPVHASTILSVQTSVGAIGSVQYLAKLVSGIAMASTQWLACKILVWKEYLGVAVSLQRCTIERTKGDSTRDKVQ